MGDQLFILPIQVSEIPTHWTPEVIIDENIQILNNVRESTLSPEMAPHAKDPGNERIRNRQKNPEIFSP